MPTSNQAEKAKTGRSATSCLECQRRKQKCSREWPCNHCQARKVPHLCQFAPRKVPTPESDTLNGLPRLSKKRKEDSFESDVSTLDDDSDHGLSDGLAKLGYMPSHGFFALAAADTDTSSGNRGGACLAPHSEEVETALKAILPKPYTDVLVQNFLEVANYQYYSVFPEQLRGQAAAWWEARAAGQKLSPELTCLLIRVCAVSTQYLDASLRQRLEQELGEKAQVLTERMHAAAQKLSSSIPSGTGGVVQVQQLFLEASWFKSEAAVVESWHALSGAIREAQEIGMHKPTEGLSDFDRELRNRLWCILWTWDWQMSTLLSRPLLIDQDDHKLVIPDGRLESITDPEIPHPLGSVALQAQLGLYVSHLFQKMDSDRSVKLILDIQDALEKWMGTFPAALRDHRPDTRWDQKYHYIPFMRCQVNIIAYCYLLAPLKPFLCGTADPEIMKTQLGANLRLKSVDTCLDLLKAGEKFYDLIFPQSIKYFFIFFFLFDGATSICSALVHDTDHSLPKRSQCIRAIRTAQELLDGMASLSQSSRISASLLRKLTATVPLTLAEKQTLGIGQALPSKKMKTSASPRALGSNTSAGAECSFSPPGGVAGSFSVVSDGTSGTSSTTSLVPSELERESRPPPSYASATQGYDSMPMQHAPAANWQYADYGAGFGPGIPTVAPTGRYVGMPMAPVARPHVGMPVTSSAGLGAVIPVTTSADPGDIGLQLGDPLTGTYLDPLWCWDRLNMNLSEYSGPNMDYHM